MKKTGSVLGIVVPALISVCLVFLKHLNNGSFVQDDFIFLRLLQESNNPVSMILTPLFGHFSPTAWTLHLLVHSSGTTWVSALILASTFVLASSVMLALIARRLGTPTSLAGAIAFVWPISLANERLMSWWSAFANDSPQTLFLLVSVFGFIGVIQNKRVPLNALISIVGSMLSFASYELAMLTPIFLIAVLPLVASFRETKQRKTYISIILGNLLFALFFFVWSRKVLPETALTADIVSAFKSVLAFAATDIAAIIGLAPPSNWRDSASLLLLLTSVFILAALLGVRFGKILFGLSPILAVAGVLAYARSGYDKSLEYPHYPNDLQYHSLSTAWFYLLCTIALGKVLKNKEFLIRSHYFASFLLIAPTLLGFLMSQITITDISGNKEMRTLVRSYQDQLATLSDEQFVANENTPFVLPIFGYYSTLASTVYVTNKLRSEQVLGGEDPLYFDEKGVLKPFEFNVGSRCLVPHTISTGFRIEVTPSSAGSILGLRLPAAVLGTRQVSGVFIDENGDFKTLALGSIQDSDQLLLTKVPLIPNTARGSEDLSLKYLDFTGALNAGDSCVQALTQR